MFGVEFRAIEKFIALDQKNLETAWRKTFQDFRRVFFAAQ